MVARAGQLGRGLTGWWSEVNSNCPAASRYEFIDFVNFFASGLEVWESARLYSDRPAKRMAG
jgi:hypothetical protein